MGVEIAELSPAFDQDDRTARLGAALVFEIALALVAIGEEEAVPDQDGAASSDDDADQDSDQGRDQDLDRGPDGDGGR
jgi:hypothetical protein